MHLNDHGQPSRVPAIAEIGRLLGDPAVAEADKLSALQLLVQDHADLDAVEAQSALWAMAQMGAHAQARQALLDCAPQLLQSSDAAHQFLDSYGLMHGADLVGADQGSAAFARLKELAMQDAELAERLASLSAYGR